MFSFGTSVLNETSKIKHLLFEKTLVVVKTLVKNIIKKKLRRFLVFLTGH